MSTASAPNVTRADQFRGLVRLGYIAKGVVYAAVGLLTASAVFGWLGGQGEVTGSRGAIRAIGQQPFGNVLLILMVIGLACYVLWRIVQAVRDTEDKGNDASGIAQRAGFAISGGVYAVLAIYAASLTRWFSGGGGGGGGKEELAARVMTWPGGPWIIAAVGAVLVGVGLYQLYRAWKKTFRKNWRLTRFTPQQERTAVRVAQFGISARGITFLIIGYLVIDGALTTAPTEATGLSGALHALAQQPAGSWMLGIISIGLICYGLYCFANARYRTIEG